MLGRLSPTISFSAYCFLSLHCFWISLLRSYCLAELEISWFFQTALLFPQDSTHPESFSHLFHLLKYRRLDLLTSVCQVKTPPHSLTLAADSHLQQHWRAVRQRKALWERLWKRPRASAQVWTGPKDAASNSGTSAALEGIHDLALPVCLFPWKTHSRLEKSR